MSSVITEKTHGTREFNCFNQKRSKMIHLKKCIPYFRSCWSIFLGVSRQVSARAWGRVHVNRNFDRIKSFPHFSSDCLNCSLKTRLEKEVRSQNWVGYVTVHLIKLKFTVTDRDRLLTRKKGYASFLASGCREFKTIMPVLWHFHLSIDKKTTVATTTNQNKVLKHRH